MTVTGTILGVDVRPAGSSSCLEVDLDCEAGPVRLIWLGRSAIEGIERGRRLQATARLAKREADLVLYNPQYELEA